MRLKFLGGAGTVTGSKTLCSTEQSNFLVDCGLFQGPREIRTLNWLDQGTLAKQIEFVILTHAHIDHSGYLPKLVKDGFEGPIYCSQGTMDLCRILLPDAAYLQTEDANYANRTGYSHHKPAVPLFDLQDAEKALRQFQALPMEEWIDLAPGIGCRLSRAGHIVGSSVVHLSRQEGQKQKILVFSGDLGRKNAISLKGPSPLIEADELVIESTYGDRVHPRVDYLKAIKEVIDKVLSRGGTLVIPAFTVGRTQDILLLIHRLRQNNQMPDVPVYVDSPMALQATAIYRHHTSELKPEIEGDEVQDPLKSIQFRAIKSPDDSMMLCMDTEPKIVITAAGMLTGGRVLHHLKAKLPDEKSGVLFVGFQAAGTKGRLLQSGLRSIRIHHTDVDVEAEIFTIESLSAHADSNEIIEWVGGMHRPPSKVIVNHGEEQAARALAFRIEQELGFAVDIASMNQEIRLN